jgi:hypothetical protein
MSTQDMRDIMQRSIKVYRDQTGNGPIDANVREYYRTPNNRFLLHEWGMGGESFCFVVRLPNGAEQ